MLANSSQPAHQDGQDHTGGGAEVRVHRSHRMFAMDAAELDAWGLSAAALGVYTYGCAHPDAPLTAAAVTAAFSDLDESAARELLQELARAGLLRNDNPPLTGTTQIRLSPDARPVDDAGAMRVTPAAYGVYTYLIAEARPVRFGDIWRAFRQPEAELRTLVTELRDAGLVLPWSRA